MHSLSRRRDHDDLRRRLGGIGPERQPAWGRMTATQMVCHLGDAFRMALGERTVAPLAGGLKAALLKQLALYAPLRWPEGQVQTVPELDQAINPSVCHDFDGEVAAVRALMDRLAAEPAPCPTHPFFGRMSRRDWMRWAWLHTDHHLRQFRL